MHDQKLEDKYAVRGKEEIFCDRVESITMEASSSGSDTSQADRPEASRTFKDSMDDSEINHERFNATILHAASVFGGQPVNSEPANGNKGSFDKRQSIGNLASSGDAPATAAKRMFSLEPMALNAFAHEVKSKFDKSAFVFTEPLTKKKHDEAEPIKQKHIDDAQHKTKGMGGMMPTRNVLGHTKSSFLDFDSERTESFPDSDSWNSCDNGDILIDFPTNREEILELKKKERESRVSSVDKEDLDVIVIEENQRKPWARVIRQIENVQSSDNEDTDVSYLPCLANQTTGKQSTEEQLYMIGFDFENSYFHDGRHLKADSIDSDMTANDSTITELKHAQRALGWHYSDVRSECNGSIKRKANEKNSLERQSSPLQPYKKERNSSDKAGSSQSLKPNNESDLLGMSNQSLQHPHETQSSSRYILIKEMNTFDNVGSSCSMQPKNEYEIVGTPIESHSTSHSVEQFPIDKQGPSSSLLIQVPTNFSTCALSATVKSSEAVRGNPVGRSISPKMSESRRIIRNFSQQSFSAVPSALISPDDSSPLDLQQYGKKRYRAEIFTENSIDAPAQVSNRMFDAELTNFIEIASENRIDKPPSMLPFTQLQSEKVAEDDVYGQVDKYQECNHVESENGQVQQVSVESSDQFIRPERSKLPNDPDFLEVEEITDLFPHAKTDYEQGATRSKGNRHHRHRKRLSEGFELEQGHRGGNKDRRRHHGRHRENVAGNEVATGKENHHERRHGRRHRHRDEIAEGVDDKNIHEKRRGRRRHHHRHRSNIDANKGGVSGKEHSHERRHGRRHRPRDGNTNEVEGDNIQEEHRKMSIEHRHRRDETRIWKGKNELASFQGRNEWGDYSRDEEKREVSPSHIVEYGAAETKAKLSGMIVPNVIVSTSEGIAPFEGKKPLNKEIVDFAKSKRPLDNSILSQGGANTPSDDGKIHKTSSTNSRIEVLRTIIGKDMLNSWRSSLRGNSLLVSGGKGESFNSIFENDDGDIESLKKTSRVKDGASTKNLVLRIQRKVGPNIWAMKWYILVFFLFVFVLIIAIALATRDNRNGSPPPTMAPSQSRTIGFKEVQNFSGTSTNNYAGASVSFSADGMYVAIGYELESGHVTNSGVVRIFELFNTSWAQFGTTIEGLATGDAFGCALSISDNGQRIAVGAKDSALGIGEVRVFEYDISSSSWQQLGNTIPGIGSNGRAGAAVSLSGSGLRVAVGGPRLSDKTGYVATYEQSGNAWVQLGSALMGQSPGEMFGTSISVSQAGDILAIGSLRAMANGQINSGKVSVYRFNAVSSTGLWTFIGSDLPGPNSGDQFGQSVSLSSDGSRLAIGANGHDRVGLKNVGACRVFALIDFDWTQIGGTLEGNHDREQSGFSIALSRDGNHLACGGPNSSVDGEKSGVVRVFQLSSIDESWQQVGEDLIASEKSAFGSSIAISQDGGYLAIGAPNFTLGDLERVGIALIYKRLL